MVADAIRQDPAWLGGEYKTEPLGALRVASDLLLIAGSAPVLWQRDDSTPELAEAAADTYTKNSLKTLDANDLLYQVEASRDYDPSPGLEKIKAPVMWINSADDFINPPGLGIADQMVKRIPRGRFILIPESVTTHGHGTHTWAALWKQHLVELLAESERK
jgi:homoserine O-acetyltransferase